MSGRKKREAALRQQAEIQTRQRQVAKKRDVLLRACLTCAVGIALIIVILHSHRKSPVTVFNTTPPQSPTFPTLEQLIAMPPAELAKVDIALMNLRCAEGLRGAEKLNIKEALAEIDEMAHAVKYHTDRYWYKFNSRREDFNNSEPFFRMMMLATVLQEDFGIRYDPALKVGFRPPEDDHFFDDSRNVLLNGLTERKMGSCASLPVLYVAVGRRLGYPLKLVPTSSHLYLRWEDSRTRLNVEATSEGFVSHPDNEYWHWPQPVSPREAEKYEYFKTFSASDDLACFLSARAEVLMANDDYEDSLKYHELAENVSPHSERYRLILKKVRPYVQYRRDFEAKKRKQANLAAVQDALAESAYVNAMNRQNQRSPMQSIAPVSPAPPIPPESVLGQ
jgi:regulator of sirC expression with transglutaminase-like and TPR domain